MATPTQQQMQQQQEMADAFMNSCAIRSIAGAGIGYVMGFVFPVVMFAFGGGMGVGDTTVGVSARTHWKSYRSEFARSMRGISKSAGGWAMIGFLFGGLELAIEKRRAKHDIWNGTVTGFVVGATQARSGGPVVAAGAGGAFAAFSALMFWVMPH